MTDSGPVRAVRVGRRLAPGQVDRPVAAGRVGRSRAEPRPRQQVQLATIEREAFAKGYAQGERAGAEAAGKRGEAMLRRLTETLDELTTLRGDDDSPDRAPDGASSRWPSRVASCTGRSRSTRTC